MLDVPLVVENLADDGDNADDQECKDVPGHGEGCGVVETAEPVICGNYDNADTPEGVQGGEVSIPVVAKCLHRDMRTWECVREIEGGMYGWMVWLTTWDDLTLNGSEVGVCGAVPWEGIALFA